MDRRKLVLVMTVGQAAVSALLFFQVLLLAPPLAGHGPAHGSGWLWVVYVLVAASSALGAINLPAAAPSSPP